ncbi:MAG: 30S ribosomal protein S20, partial [Candidatus Rokuibacteriota bacterium]
MANTKSALKRIRQNEKRRARNRTERSRVRTAVKMARTAGSEGGADARATALAAMRALDKA